MVGDAVRFPGLFLPIQPARSHAAPDHRSRPQTYGLPPRTQREAWRIYRQLQTDPYVGFAQEPEGVEERWEKLSSMDHASPKLWMDSWLPSIAILSGFTLVTFDFGFRQFDSAGLQLTLLKPA